MTRIVRTCAGFGVAALALAGISAPSVASDEGGACDSLSARAPILTTDTRDDGSAIEAQPLSDGRVQPVIVVHGWTARGVHDDTRTTNFSHLIDRQANGMGGEILAAAEVHRSFIGALQAIPGVVVYSFDYHEVSSRWVTDPDIGPKLGQAIDCVASDTGIKPVVIGHSMGGLALREALSMTDADGASVAQAVADVVTFGTPEEGTALLASAGKAVDTAMWVPGLNIPVALFKVFAHHCSQMADQTGEFCLGVGGPPDAFYSQGALAMYPGSPELEALPAWPQGLAVTGLAGHIHVGGFSLFGLNPRIADLGDLAVPVDSALAGATRTQVIECEYGIASVASTKETVTRVVRAGDTSRRRPAGLVLPTSPGTEFASPCYHNNLMSESALTGAAVDVVQARALDPISVEVAQGSAVSDLGEHEGAPEEIQQ